MNLQVSGGSFSIMQSEYKVIWYHRNIIIVGNSSLPLNMVAKVFLMGLHRMEGVELVLFSFSMITGFSKVGSMVEKELIPKRRCLDWGLCYSLHKLGVLSICKFLVIPRLL